MLLSLTCMYLDDVVYVHTQLRAGAGGNVDPALVALLDRGL